ncbi:MAG TPA: YvcK family protein [Aggregatilineales bacterium]|nr:YvcK family protein [Anaerolineales bacterium]HRE49613.1 YvcK family protein [Aggregatilineales bacterium]
MANSDLPLKAKGSAAQTLPRQTQTVQTVRRGARLMRTWLTPGIGVKRWALLLMAGIAVCGIAIAEFLRQNADGGTLSPLLHLVTLRFLLPTPRILVGLILGVGVILLAFYKLNRSILAPFVKRDADSFVNTVEAYYRRQRGARVVAIGGGTGLPAVLRAMKPYTLNLTAIVTVADDGGSSGKLRREMGVLPPGDIRNNIAALADDEHLVTQLFQYRFENGGGLAGHSFGNLLLTAMADITGSMDQAIIEAGKVLNITGRVLPATLSDVKLCAEVRDERGLRRVEGESNIPEAGGRVERVYLEPEHPRPYPDTIRAILNADLVVIGPGSLYTSILPNLLVEGMPEAIRASSALCVYVCNIATQQGETGGYGVADHVAALEHHIGKGVIDIILANNATPQLNAGERTKYVPLAHPHDPIRERYRLIEVDLADPNRPWRHSPTKLARVLMGLIPTI